MPTDLSGQPLDALKQWLAISTAREDALLLRLLESAWRMCLRGVVRASVVTSGSIKVSKN